MDGGDSSADRNRGRPGRDRVRIGVLSWDIDGLGDFDEEIVFDGRSDIERTFIAKRYE